MRWRDRPQGSAEIAQQVEAIQDLAGLRGADSRALGEHLGAVTSDNGNVGMPMQPSRDALGGAVGQKIENRVPLQVDEHGAVAAAAPPRPLIDTDHARFGMGRQRSGPDEAQERVAAHGHGQTLRQPGCRLAAESETEVALEVV